MKELTEQEEKEMYDQYKSTFKERVVDWIYSLVDRVDDGIVLIAAMCTVLFILIAVSCCSQPSPIVDQGFNYQKDWYSQSNQIMDYYNFPRQINWDDNILNPDNYDYLIETIYNIGIDNPLKINVIELQYLFIERYFDTCQEISQEWFDWYKEYKGY